PISRMHAHRFLREAFDSCEMTGPLGTHSMRKTFARRVHQRLGNDLAKTKEALGQKSITATMHYMSFLHDEIDQAILAQCVRHPLPPWPCRPAPFFDILQMLYRYSHDIASISIRYRVNISRTERTRHDPRGR